MARFRGPFMMPPPLTAGSGLGLRVVHGHAAQYFAHAHMAGGRVQNERTAHTRNLDVHSVNECHETLIIS